MLASRGVGPVPLLLRLCLTPPAPSLLATSAVISPCRPVPSGTRRSPPQVLPRVAVLHSRPSLHPLLLPSSSATPIPPAAVPQPRPSTLTSLLRRTFIPFSKPSLPLFAQRPSYYSRPGVSQSSVSRPSNNNHRRGGGGGWGRGPGNEFRRQFDALPQHLVLWSIVGTNVIVFLLWQYAYETYQRFRDPSLLLFMRNNFTVSWRNVTSGRLWTLLSACWSHERGGHIVMNLLSLYFMAPPVLALLGNTGFVALYVFSGIVSSGFSLLFNHFVAPRTPFSANYSSHGASGAVYGTIAFFAACYPRTTFLIFFVIPCPAWACVSGIFAWDLFSSFNSPTGTTDSAGHVGGVAAGLFWFLRKVGRVG